MRGKELKPEGQSAKVGEGKNSVNDMIFSGGNTKTVFSTGDLPDGAMAFSKLLKYQKEWSNLADSVKTRGSEMDEKEVLGVKFFLKQLANEYYDMEVKYISNYPGMSN